MSTPRHCPGYDSFKHLKSFVCKCPYCGKEAEVFSDEFDRPRTCSGCGKQIDFDRCRISGEAGSVTP
jgi:endogenous inhibitor of DNA gyrase (YacG/DUF329 family)